MNKVLILLFVCFISVGCGGGSGGGNDDSSTVKTINVSGVGTTTVVNEGGKYNLNISGVSNNITITYGNEVEELKVSGTSNVITIENGVTVSSFTMSGASNTVFVPFGSSISFTGSGVGNVLKTRTTNSITGIWSFTYPATQCVETYNFKTDGTFSETSLDEVAGGSYVFEETVVTGTRHLLSLSFTSDNGLSDCNGLSEDDSGLNVTIYQNHQSATVIEWFSALEGGAAIIVLTKL